MKKTIIVSLIIAGVISIIMHFWSPTNIDDLSIINKYSSALTEDERFIGICTSDALSMDVKVYYADFVNKYTSGMYNFDAQIILFKPDRLSINTISHEVSHFIDDILDKKGIYDHETEAYLQGYFTECVYNLITNQ